MLTGLHPSPNKACRVRAGLGGLPSGGVTVSAGTRNGLRSRLGTCCADLATPGSPATARKPSGGLVHHRAGSHLAGGGVHPQRPGQRTNTTGSNPVKWLGSGLYVCGVCGQAALRVSQIGGKYRPAYRCSQGQYPPERARHPRRAAPGRLSSGSSFLPAPTRHHRPVYGADRHGSGYHRAAYRGRRHRPRLTALSAAFAEGAITLTQLRTGTGKLRARLTEIDDTLTAAARVNPLIGLAGQPIIAEIWYGTIPERCDGLDIGCRRAVLATLLTVTVLPTNKGRPPNGSYFKPTESTSNEKH